MELLFTGGRVLTMDPLDRVASGVAIRDGRIIAVGDSSDARNAVGPTRPTSNCTAAPWCPASATPTTTSR